jgi:hypothetical protein
MMRLFLLLLLMLMSTQLAASLVSTCNIGAVVNDRVSTEPDEGPSIVTCANTGADASVIITPDRIDIDTVRPFGPWNRWAAGTAVSVQDIDLEGFAENTVVPLTLHMALFASMEQVYYPSNSSLADGNTNFDIDILASAPGAATYQQSWSGYWHTRLGVPIDSLTYLTIPGYSGGLPAGVGAWSWTDIIEVPLEVNSHSGLDLRVTANGAAWSFPDYFSRTLVDFLLLGVTSEIYAQGNYSAMLGDGTEFALLNPDTVFQNPFTNQVPVPSPLYLLYVGVFMLHRRVRSRY